MPEEAGRHRKKRKARHRALPIVDVVRIQQDACAQAGSSIYAQVLDGMATDVEVGGVCGRLMEPWAANAMADAIPLRLLGAVHRIVLSGRAPDLAALYPSAGGVPEGDPWPAFAATVAEYEDEITSEMGRNVQTNEVGRSCSLLGGFHAAAASTGLPLRTLEVGASAGLLMHWDRYGYDVGTTTWGEGLGPTFSADAFTSAPLLHGETAVAERRGCDISPIDVTTPDGCLALRGFLWPDQNERRTRLDAALDVAAAHPAPVEKADAGDWVTEALASPEHGVATVVYHSIVLQYLPRESFHTMRSAILAAIASAPSDAPVFWLRMEPAGAVADVRLCRRDRNGTTVDETLATSGYHGPPVTWNP